MRRGGTPGGGPPKTAFKQDWSKGVEGFLEGAGTSKEAKEKIFKHSVVSTSKDITKKYFTNLQIQILPVHPFPILVSKYLSVRYIHLKVSVVSLEFSLQL